MKRASIEEKRQERKKSAVVGVVLFTLLQVACAICFGALCFIPDAPGWVVILFGAMAVFCLMLIVPACLLLKERFKEIEGGELDAAAEY